MVSNVHNGVILCNSIHMPSHLTFMLGHLRIGTADHHKDWHCLMIYCAEALNFSAHITLLIKGHDTDVIHS